MLLSLALDPNYRFESIFNPEIIIKGIKMIKSAKAIIVISRRRAGRGGVGRLEAWTLRSSSFPFRQSQLQAFNRNRRFQSLPNFKVENISA